MPPKPKTKCRRKGGSVSDDLFHYNNQVELTFKNQAKSKALGTLKDANSSSSEDEEEPVSKRKVETVETNTNHSSSSENEYDLIGWVSLKSRTPASGPEFKTGMWLNAGPPRGGWAGSRGGNLPRIPILQGLPTWETAQNWAILRLNVGPVLGAHVHIIFWNWGSLSS